MRSPVLEDVTARISSSVCRLPFINSSPLARMNEFDRGGRRSIAVRHIDDFVFCDIETVLAGDSLDLGSRTNQDRNNDAGFGRLDRTSQRSFVARVHHQRRGRRDGLGPRNQPLILGVRMRRFRLDGCCGGRHRISPVGFETGVADVNLCVAITTSADDWTFGPLAGILATLDSDRSASNSADTRSSRILTSGVRSPDALMTSRRISSALRRSSALSGSSAGIAASAAS